MPDSESVRVFYSCFAVSPWAALPPDAEGFEMGCGGGRWALFVAPRVGRLHCIDPSKALDVARRNLAALSNAASHRASVDAPGLPPASQDFGYSLGVLHHVPDAPAAIRSCVALLKPGAPLLLYLYYSFNNWPAWFWAVWRAADLARRLIYHFPPGLKHAMVDAIAVLVYWPLARLSRGLERLGFSVVAVPVSSYRHYSFIPCAQMRAIALARRWSSASRGTKSNQ